MLRASTIGYAVPASAGNATVHSVFVRACNVDVDGALVTIGEEPLCPGPSNIVIQSIGDLRALFRAGEPVEWRDGRARFVRATLEFAGARRWHPVRPRKVLLRAIVERNLRAAPAYAATDLRAALARACRGGQAMRASRLALRLIGLGEGLTPSGDDFLAGLMAGLPRRSPVRRRVERTVLANLVRTNAISAHALRLAASGRFNEDVLRARDALESSRRCIRRALAPLLATGASSGTATCAGLRAGLAAQRR